jgi:hypothetical protein
VDQAKVLEKAVVRGRTEVPGRAAVKGDKFQNKKQLFKV